MTAQIGDSVNYLGEAFDIAGIAGAGLFNPIEHGVHPWAFTTACRRGFHCKYLIEDEALFLTQINIGLIAHDVKRGVRLFGRVPETYPWSRDWVTSTLKHENAPDSRFIGLREVMPFSGGILLAREFIRDMYDRSWAYQPVYNHRVIHELIFENGRLIKALDQSHRGAELRMQILKKESLEQEHANRQITLRVKQRTFFRTLTNIFGKRRVHSKPISSCIDVELEEWLASYSLAYLG